MACEFYQGGAMPLLFLCIIERQWIPAHCHPERNEAKRSEVERSVVKSRFLPPAGGQA